MENGAFAPKEQMLHFPSYFQIHDISMALLWSKGLLFDFINLTQVHNFTVSAQAIFTFRRLSVFTASFTGILQVLMQIMNRFVPSNWLVKWL